ncbi:MAG: hypothetical protein Q4C96_07455 [Planctomycetia bacterium]|nr:hypothetical protein [Planctomycetia bacterium]
MSTQAEKSIRIFIAGIMQGSFIDKKMHTQDYRTRLKHFLESHYPEADVYDPLANHTQSVEYAPEKGKEVFLFHNYLCREVDVLIAFVPEASMGTAIEMWEAWQNGGKVITISPMKKNWAIRFLSHHLFETLEDFETAIQTGKVTLNPKKSPSFFASEK